MKHFELSLMIKIILGIMSQHNTLGVTKKFILFCCFSHEINIKF